MQINTKKTQKKRKFCRKRKTQKKNTKKPCLRSPLLWGPQAHLRVKLSVVVPEALPVGVALSVSVLRLTEPVCVGDRLPVGDGLRVAVVVPLAVPRRLREVVWLRVDIVGSQGTGGGGVGGGGSWTLSEPTQTDRTGQDRGKLHEGGKICAILNKTAKKNHTNKTTQRIQFFP